MVIRVRWAKKTSNLITSVSSCFSTKVHLGFIIGMELVFPSHTWLTNIRFKVSVWSTPPYGVDPTLWGLLGISAK